MSNITQLHSQPESKELILKRLESLNNSVIENEEAADSLTDTLIEIEGHAQEIREQLAELNKIYEDYQQGINECIEELLKTHTLEMIPLRFLEMSHKYSKMLKKNT